MERHNDPGREPGGDQSPLLPLEEADPSSLAPIGTEPETADGRNLRKLLEESGRLDWQDVADLGIQLAQALQQRHAAVTEPHRLLMPETILRTRDGLGYRLADAATVQRLIRSDVLVGSEEYRAPEEWRTPDKVDARADQFALGVVLHEALAGNGRRPFDVVIRPPRIGEGVSASYTPRHDLRALAADAPEGLVRVIERATRLNANNRFESCAALAAALRAVLEPPAPEWTAPVAAKRRMWPRVAMVVGLIAVLAAVGLLASRLLVIAPGIAEMESARQEAERAQAPQYASGLWRQAELYQPSQAYRQRTDLYISARKQAWTVRLAAVVDAARQAVELGATGEESFQQAEAARAQAQQEWSTGELAAASRSLTLADAGFRNAVAARRTQWAARIQQDLSAEVGRIPAAADHAIVTMIRSRQAAIQRTLEDRQASPDDLQRAEKGVNEVAAAVAVQVQRTGLTQSAQRNAEAAIAGGERTRHTLERLADTSRRTRAAYDRGVELLEAARLQRERDPTQAAMLANEAMASFHKLETVAEAELATQRRAVAEAQRRVDQRRLGSRGSLSVALEYREPSAAGSRSSGTNPEISAGAPRAVAPVAPNPAVASVAPSQRGIAPMSPLLARQIQGWMGQRCDQLNRDFEATHNSRARCESLTVLDRHDSAHVQISYVLTIGGRNGEGWLWQRPEQRRPVLDCSSDSCRCLSGC